MPGFPLLNLGTALGGLVKGYDQQQQDAQQRQLNVLLQQLRQQQLQQVVRDQKARQLLGALAGTPDAAGLFGAGGGQMPQPPMPGESSQPAGGSQNTAFGPPPDNAPPASGGGGMSPVPWKLDTIARDESGNRNIMQTAYDASNPNAINPSTGTHTAPSSASGYYQITNTTWRNWAPKVGVDVNKYPTAISAPKDVQTKVAEYGLQTEGTRPWAPYNPRLARDLGVSGGRGGVGVGGGAAAGDGGSMPRIAPPIYRPPPQGYDMNNLAAQLRKTNPGIDPETMFSALDQYQHLMDGPSKDAWERFKFETNTQRHDYEFGVDEQDKTLDRQMRDRQFGIEEQRLAAQDFRSDRQFKLEQDRLGEETRFHDLQVGKGRASKNITVADGQGNQIFSGSAHQTGTGEWVSDATQKAIDVPEDGTLKIAGTGGPGRQAQTAILRVTAAGNELAAATKNLVDLPIGATAGVFSGLQGLPPDQLKGAVTRSLANKLTPEDAQSVLVSFQGVARAIAQLEAVGAAQGLVGLTKTAQVLMPLAGDSSGTILRKYAELRQIAERAMETMGAAPDLGSDQKKLLKKITDEVRQAIPWTVADVNRIERDPDAETVKEFAAKVGASGGGGNTGAALPPARPTATDAQGNKVEWDGTAWVPVK